MTLILNEIYEQDFLKCSFGFRPGLSCHHALATVNTILDRRKSEYVLEDDIQDFFGSLSHEWLGRFLRLRIGDERVLNLIEALLKAGFRDRIRRMKHWPVGEQQKVINAMLRAHFNYYGIAVNGKKLAAFWNFTRQEWRHSLSKRSQKGRLTWEAFVAHLERNPLAPPKVRIQYPDLAAYTRL